MCWDEMAGAKKKEKGFDCKLRWAYLVYLLLLLEYVFRVQTPPIKCLPKKKTSTFPDSRNIITCKIHENPTKYFSKLC